MQIEIPDSLLKRLQKHATPFVDTPLSVIERWGDYYEKHNGMPLTDLNASPFPRSVERQTQTLRKFDPRQPPSLLHTRVQGIFDTTGFTKWNDLVRLAHVHAVGKGISFDELKRISWAQIRKGLHTSEGFKPIPELDMSIQGVDADHAWEYALRLAMHLRVPLSVEIEWRHNDKAAHPGERASMEWRP